PHQLCHFHYLREAAQPIYEADRHAKKELKKRVRGVRKIERQVEGRVDPLAEIVQWYYAVMRSALLDDGRPPLVDSLTKVEKRLAQQGQSQQAQRLEHFVKVSTSYEPGLFHCYDVKDLPRTNNELEQFFGSYRHHERRISGRKVASASLVVRGAVRVVAAVAT